MRRQIQLVGTALAGLLVVVLVLNVISPTKSRSVKMVEEVGSNLDEFTHIFIGPSYLQDLNRKVFEQVLSRSNGQTKTHFIGYGGMTIFEGIAALDELSYRNLPSDTVIIMDITLDIPFDIEPENQYTRRVIDWHRPHEFAALVSGSQFNRSDIASVLMHLGHLFVNLSALGHGSDWVSKTFLNTEAMSPRKVVRRKGQRSKKMAHLNRKNRRMFQDAVAILSKRQGADIAPSERDLLKEREILRVARRIKTPIVFVISPVTRSDIFIPRSLTKLPNVEFLVFNRPGEFPELYRAEDRRNLNHFNSAGVDSYSRLFADKYLQLMSGR